MFSRSLPNENYASYVEGYQSEMRETCGDHGLPPVPVDKRKRGVAKLQKAYMMTPEFKELWERIKHKTRYSVRVRYRYAHQRGSYGIG